MTAVEYQRPSWPEMLCRDADGRVIPYGTRWSGGSPPEDSYSRVTNPQRLAPLIDITHALIQYLDHECKVHRTTDGNVTVLDPGPTAASLRLDIDPVDYFVGVTAGPVAQFVFPVCACDACDETVEPVADDLEATVFAVVAGHLRQRIDRPRNPWWAPQHSPGTQRGGLVIELGGEHPSSSWSLLDRAERRRIQALLRATPDHEVGLAPKTFTDPPLCAATVDRRALRRTHHQHRQPVPTAGCRGALSRTSPCCLRRGPRHRQHRTGTDHRRRPEHRLAHLTPVIRRNGG